MYILMDYVLAVLNRFFLTSLIVVLLIEYNLLPLSD